MHGLGLAGQTTGVFKHPATGSQVSTVQALLSSQFRGVSTQVPRNPLQVPITQALEEVQSESRMHEPADAAAAAAGTPIE
jgi:hypothetical protein